MAPHIISSLDQSLAHLDEIVDDVDTLASLQQSAGRPALLAHLKRLGVDKLGDRQAVAGVISRATKAGRLNPTHVALADAG